METKENAIDCKFEMVAIAQCQVAGVQYKPGDAITVASADSREYLIAHNAAKDKPAESASIAPPTPTDAEAVSESEENPTEKVENGKSAKRFSRGR